MAGPQLAVEMTGDEVKLFKSLQKIIGQQKKMEDGFNRVKRKGQDAGKSSSNAFGSRAMSGIKSYVAGMASISTAIGVANDALRNFEQTTQRAMDQTRTLASGRRSLVQIAGGDSTRLRQLNTRADSAAAEFGVERDVARQILFSAVSEGFEQDFEKILRADPLFDPQAAATVAGQTPALFNNQITSTEALNAVGVAAAQSRLQFEQVAGALPQAAQGASLNQTSPEETIAALAVTASRTKSGDTAATLIGNFASKASLDERTQGQGIIQALETVQGMTPEEQREFLGTSKELNEAFTLLSQNMDRIKQQTNLVSQAIGQTGTSGSFLNQGVTTGLSDPRTLALVESNKSRISREIAEEDALATRGFALQSSQDKALANLTSDSRITATDRFVAEKVGGVAGFLGVDPQTSGLLAEGFGRAGTSEQQALRLLQGLFSESNDTQKEMLKELRQQNGNTLSAPDADR